MDFIWIKDLCRVSYCLVKEGDEFEKSIGDFYWIGLMTNPIDLQTSGTTGFLK
jgi:O-succinylbenzoic acid--CoA ligase